MTFYLLSHFHTLYKNINTRIVSHQLKPQAEPLLRPQQAARCHLRRAPGADPPERPRRPRGRELHGHLRLGRALLAARGDRALRGQGADGVRPRVRRHGSERRRGRDQPQARRPRRPRTGVPVPSVRALPGRPL